VENGDLKIPNRNLDTGEPTRAGQYFMADEAYDDLVRRLAKTKFAHLTPDLKTAILSYFNSGSPRDKLSHHDWKKTEEALKELKAYTPSPDANPQPSS